MGLDLTIREQTDFTKDEQGRTTWKVTELVNLRNCHEILDKLNWSLETGFENCGTHSFYAGKFVEILNELKEDLEKTRNRDINVDIISKKQLTDRKEIERNAEYKKSQIGTLEYEIEVLSDFLNTENITDEEDEDRSFEVHAWW